VPRLRGAVEPDCTVYGSTSPTGEPPAPDPVHGELKEPVVCAAAVKAKPHSARVMYERKRFIGNYSSDETFAWKCPARQRTG